MNKKIVVSFHLVVVVVSIMLLMLLLLVGAATSKADAKEEGGSTTIPLRTRTRRTRSCNGGLLDRNKFRRFFPDEISFLEGTSIAPILDLPMDDDDYLAIMIAYYYRVRSFRKHIRKTDDQKYWVVTEFLPDVPWAGTSNTISAAAGHHIMEGRWFWDAPTFVEDYIRFWYLGSGSKPSPQRHIKRYTNWIYHAAWQYGLLWDNINRDNNNNDDDDDNSNLFRDTFAMAADVFRTEYVEKYLTNSTSNQHSKSAGWNKTDRVCWTQEDGYDAMEVSVSGSGCRPTIASAMWGEAMALVYVATNVMKDSDAAAKEFQNWATFTRNVITQQHWNPIINSFAVIPPPKPSEYSIQQLQMNPPVSSENCELNKIRTPNKLVNVRELLAFMPWYYSSLLQMPSSSSSDNDNESNNHGAQEEQAVATWAKQFQWLLESTGNDGLSGKWGLRTVQRSTPCYNYSWDHGDCWNGPSWPYETSRVLTGIANLLVEYPPDVIKASGVDAKFFEHLLVQYAIQHTQTRAVNDTAHPLHSGHVFENLHPDLGYWNNRERMYWNNDTNKDMGDDYNHSTFLDLVLNCWLGIRTPKKPTASSSSSSMDDDNGKTNSNDNDEWLVIDPLIQAPYFVVEQVPYRGRTLDIAYDSTGTYYRSSSKSNNNNSNNHVVPGKGMTVYIDGKVVATRPDLGRLVIPTEPPKAKKEVEGDGGDTSAHTATAIA